jgi:hypothetical protein
VREETNEGESKGDSEGIDSHESNRLDRLKAMVATILSWEQTKVHLILTV